MLVRHTVDLFGSAGSILFVPYALNDHDAYLERMNASALSAGYDLVGIHRCPDPVQAFREAEGIYVGGGNSFRLLDSLCALGLLDVMRAGVLAGTPYAGVSAGSNLACPNIITTNDMPIVVPPTLDALGLVPFQINAHYYSGSTWIREGDRFEEHFGETRDERIEQFHEVHETPVIGLREGSLLRIEDGRVQLHGASARRFLPGAEPVDIGPGEPLLP